ncbi:MAG TPA: hypothetical protein PKV66_00105 [Candidatus Pelethenecus sp.]|nr:hypothetical protein [Candidatus Pelethenecus sp.]
MKTTTKKKLVRTKTKTNFEKNLEAEIEQALENAEQIKSWNKFGSTDFSYVYVFMAGIILGLAIACIVVTPSIIDAIG